MVCRLESMQVEWGSAQSSHWDQPGGLAWSKWNNALQFPHKQYELSSTLSWTTVFRISIHLTLAEPCFGLLAVQNVLKKGGLPVGNRPLSNLMSHLRFWQGINVSEELQENPE